MTTPEPDVAGPVGTELHVMMYGRHIATLSRGTARAAKVTLTYTDEAQLLTRGISCCLPVVGEQYSGAVVDHWISGLLPDRSEVLTRWRSRFRLTRLDAFALLWHVGGDVTGAARFVRPETRGGVDIGILEPITDQEIGDRIRTLREDAAAWLPSASSGQFSLAGAQAKFALARTSDGWAQAFGAAPTTHIIKPAIVSLADQDLNEHLTMRLAAAVGLPVAATEVLEFDGARALVVTRFDRYQSTADTWARIHQEDTVQALGLPPSHKYEADGGPGVPKIVELLRRNVNGGHAAADVDNFIDAVAFNWLVVGTDAHARNYSLLHHGSSTRLAPLYDVNSFLAYRDLSRTATLAMRVGFTETDPDKVSARDWDELARDSNLDPAEVLARVRTMAERLLDTTHADLAEAAQPWTSPLTRRLHRALLKHVRACQLRIP